MNNKNKKKGDNVFIIIFNSKPYMLHFDLLQTHTKLTLYKFIYSAELVL